MRDEPEVVKILREEERTGKLYQRSSPPCKELDSNENTTDTLPTSSNDYKENNATATLLTKRKQSLEQNECCHKTTEDQIIQLKKLDKIKTSFLSVTSHELRTPMSIIKGYIQMMLKGNLGTISNEQKKALDIILRNSNRLDTLIQDILDISRLESGTMKFIPERTNVKTMLEQTIETMQAIADTKNIKINLSLEEKTPDLIIDQERIKQVFVNLLNNAIKFSYDRSIITIFARKTGNYVLFEIQDFGRGIPKDKQDKIFEIFYQTDLGRDRKFGGVGLGLAISRGIILSHGGNIWVESEPEKGSTFRLTLPITPVQDLEGKFRDADIFKLNDTQREIENDLRDKTIIWNGPFEGRGKKE
jgi:signal transduction histidine kinase